MLLIKNTKIAELPKEKYLIPVEWSDYKQYRLTHIVYLNAFTIAGNKIIPSNQPNIRSIKDLAVYRCLIGLVKDH